MTQIRTGISTKGNERVRIGRQIGPFVNIGNGLSLAPARLYGRQLHVTTDGKPAYDERYERVSGFVRVGKGRHLAAARLDGHEFHIKPNGKRAYAAEFSSVEDFEQTKGRGLTKSRMLAVVTVGNGETSMSWHRINPFGKRIPKA